MGISLPFDLLFEQATLAIVVVNKAGNIVSVNPFAQKLFEYNSEELLGKTIECLIPDKYRQQHVHHRAQYEQQPKNRAMGGNMRLFALKKSGITFPVEVSISKSAESGLTIAFIIDISIRAENEAYLKQQLENAYAIKQLNDELEQKVIDRTKMLKETLTQLEYSNKELEDALSNEKELSDLKTRFVSMASHEFKTPLSTILSSVSLIEKYRITLDTEKQQKHIERIKSAVKNLSSVLDEFLSLGRLNEGKIVVTKEHFSLNELIEDIISEMQLLKKNTQQIAFHTQGNIAVFSDNYMLRNAIVNIISNSLKYSNDNALINITLSRTATNAEIEIADNGIGICEQDLKHITELFFRGRNAVNIQGTGLGLNIVQRYMTELGGSFFIESKEKKGTTVRLEIPLA